MSTLNTSGTFKERLPYLIMALLFTVGVVFCIINTYEFFKLLNNDPNDVLEVSHAYTYFLIGGNILFAVIFAFLLIVSVRLAVNPRGDNWARKFLNYIKVFKTASIESLKEQQQKLIDAYQPSIPITSKGTYGETLRGPKITYTCPKDRETPIPVMNEPIKRITLDDFEPYDSKKNKFVTMTKHPLTLDSLKELYLSKSSR